MYTNASKNETDSEISMKRVVVNYYTGFFECMKNSLKDFGLFLIAKSPPKLKMILNSKIDPIGRDDHSGFYMILFIKETG